MKNFITTLALSILVLTACSPKNEPLATQREIEQPKVDIPKYDPIPPQKFTWITQAGGQSQLEFNPKVDILFVIDNSDSMKSAQANLKKNIDKFSAGIVKNRMMDFHIGVTSTWDSTERAMQARKDGNQIGELLNIKDANGKRYKQRFLNRSLSTPAVLASTIDIGVTPYKDGGPEIEEFFSVIQAATEKSGHGAANEGFFRDDAQLVVIVMTDADDSTSRISPEQMAQYLIDFKKGQADKVSVYGVLVRAQDPDSVKDWDLKVHPKYHPECFEMVGKTQKNNGKCTGFGPERLEQFIVAANQGSGTPDYIRKNFIMAITSPNFGSDLARIGSDIAVKTLEKKIYLEQRPRYDEVQKKIMVRVRYGSPNELAAGRGQIIPQGEKGWLYNPDDNSIHLSGHIQYEYVEGAQFAVDLIPLTLKRD